MSSYRRYLGILGLQQPVKGLDGLKHLVFRQVTKIPFENVSKLLLFGREGNGRTLTMEEYLDGIEQRDLGGTCYSCNPFFSKLLKWLGYDADLLGADMKAQNVHTCIRVRIDGVHYHVDVGYAAPFLIPIRLDRLPYAINQGDFRYVIDKPFSPSDNRLGVTIVSDDDNTVLHGYRVNEVPRQPEFFKQTIRDSFGPDHHFMHTLRITKVFASRVIEIRDNLLLHIEGEHCSKEILTDMAMLKKAVSERLQLPRMPIEAAVSIFESLTGNSIFDRNRIK